MPRATIGSQDPTQSQGTQGSSFQPTMDTGYTRETHLQRIADSTPQNYPEPTQYAHVHGTQSVVEIQDSQEQGQRQGQTTTTSQSQTPVQSIHPSLRNGSNSDEDLTFNDSDSESSETAILALEVDKEESLAAWYLRASNELKGDANGAKAVLQIPRKARGVAVGDLPLSTAAKVEVNMFIAVQIRLLYICDLSKIRLNVIMKYFFKDLKGQDQQNAYIQASYRANGSFSSWKCRTLKEFRKYIADLAATDKVFGQCSDIRTIHMLLRAQWSLDTFLSIFKFAKDTIDFRASDKRVERWCKVIFLDMGGNLKMEWNYAHGHKFPEYKLKPDPKYCERMTRRRWNLYGVNEKYDALRPNIGDVKYIYTAAKEPAKVAGDNSGDSDKEIIDDMYMPDDF